MKFEEFDLSKNADGLLPVVVQDATTLKVLMVAYMNKEAPGQTTVGQASAFAQPCGRGQGCQRPGGGGTCSARAIVPAVCYEPLLCKSAIEHKAHLAFSSGCPKAPLHRPFPRILLRVIILSQILAPWRRK